MEIDESNLTGENKPRSKTTEIIAVDNGYELNIQARRNIAFMGTLVRNGMLGEGQE